MTQAEKICPHISSVDEVKIFIAEDSNRKRQDIFASLGAVGISTEAIVEIAEDYEQAAAFIDRQQPGNLEANVFMLDGSLAMGEPLWQGHQLALNLFIKYEEPIQDISKKARQDLAAVHGGRMSKTGIDAIVSPEAAWDVALTMLNQDALLVGISSDRDRGLHGSLAKIPWASDLSKVGELTLSALMGDSSFRKHINYHEKMKSPLRSRPSPQIRQRISR